MVASKGTKLNDSWKILSFCLLLDGEMCDVLHAAFDNKPKLGVIR